MAPGAMAPMAPGSWSSGPYAGDQITMPCGVGVPMGPMGPTAHPTVTMLPTGNPCDLDDIGDGVVMLEGKHHLKLEKTIHTG